MPREWEEPDNEVVSGSSCPVPECGALAVAYGRPDQAGTWEFTCPRCGIDFTAPASDLIFQSVPKNWLLARVEGDSKASHARSQRLSA